VPDLVLENLPVEVEKRGEDKTQEEVSYDLSATDEKVSEVEIGEKPEVSSESLLPSPDDKCLTIDSDIKK
jgi:hypothetical protein